MRYFKENSSVISNLGFEPLILNIIKNNISDTPGKLKFPSRYAPPNYKLDKVDQIIEENKENLSFLSNFDDRNFEENGILFSSESEFIENAKLRDMKIEKLDLNPVNIFKENDEDFMEVEGILGSTLRCNQNILNFQKVLSTFRQDLNSSFDL